MHFVLNGEKNKMFKKFKVLMIIILSISIVLVLSIPLQADVPPPPVNQIIGVNDGVFNDLIEAECRFCHENPDQFPVEDETIPNRHHIIVGRIIPNVTDVPFGNPGEPYECFSCHAVDCSSGECNISVDRDCVVCHIQSSIFEATVHHRTELAQGTLPQGPDCKACHGSLVENRDDGHFIPSSPPTERTPKRSGGTGLPLNSEGNGAGACDYCHSTGTGDPTIPGIDSASGIFVYSNKDAHHEAGFWGGFGAHGFVCQWCHDFDRPFEEQFRVCENCHGRDSLHNIQVDSDGDGVINPGIEMPGYGHIGNPDDCWGCHGFFSQLAGASISSASSESSAPETGPIVPHISSTSASVLVEGTEKTIIIYGSAFTNLSEGVEYTSNVSLTADDDTSIELIPDSISENTVTVTIPNTLTADNYILKAVKLDKVSNPMVISVKPEVVIIEVNCNKKMRVLTITGSGCGEKVEGTDDYINVKVNSAPVEIILWTDTEIKALISRCSKKAVITVNALFGSVTNDDGSDNGGGKPDKPCKGEKC